MVHAKNEPQVVIERWVAAMDAHDIEAAAACFAENYRDEKPTRPGQDFQGRDRVRKNFSALFAEIPDLKAQLLGAVTDAGTVWMEWRMSGTRTDGTRFAFAGVNLFGVDEGVITWGRIYSDLVQETGDIDAQIERMTKG